MDNEFEKNSPMPEEEAGETVPAVDAVAPEATEPENTTCEYKPEPVAEYIAPQPVPQVMPVAPQKPEKKKKYGWKMVAVGLCCALVGSAVGVASTLFTLRLFGGAAGKPVENVAGILLGQRENSVIEIEKIDTSKLLTAAEVYAANVNSTVSINATGTATGGYWGSQQAVGSAGSGFVLSHDGYVLTNYHVVEGMDAIKVTMYDKRELPATLIGYDEGNDIAVLKVEGENLTPVVLGDSDNLNVGDHVVAIGNPLGELSFTLTAGYISAKDRVITLSGGTTMTLLQTDCPINSGNSGGALFNMYGEVIGITNAKYSNNGSSEASIDNIGFAIPMNRVKEIVFSIIEKGMVTKPYVGISVQNVTEQMISWGVPNGAWVVAVENGAPAAKGGLRVDDIITHVDGEVVDSSSAIVAMVSNYKPGQSVVFTVYRGGRTLELTIVIGEKVQPATGK